MAAPNNTDTVNAYMAQLEHPYKEEMEAIRSIILKADKKLAERIKWNAPSFYYKKDMAVFHPRSQQHVHVVFVFYNGTMIDSPILEGDYKDRRMAYFKDMKDVKAKKAELTRVVKEWVRLIDETEA